jgi:hypothetical protein
MFISVGSKDWINLDHVVQIVHSKDSRGGVQTTFRFTDGTLQTIPGRYNAPPNFVIPAQPGYILIDFFPDCVPAGDPETCDLEPGITRSNIMAWKFEAGSGDYPIALTLDGNDDQTMTCAILEPSGRVVRACDTSWRTYDEWLGGQRIRLQKARTKAA